MYIYILIESSFRIILIICCNTLLASAFFYLIKIFYIVY